jgi:hypothetical protein
LTLTAVALVSTALALRRKTDGVVSTRTPTEASFSLRGTIAPIALLALFLGGYIAVMLAGEDFTAYDNSQLTLYSLRGTDFPPPIWRDSGRFFPSATKRRQDTTAGSADVPDRRHHE